MDGLDAMLENGPWFIRNNPLILKKWHPDENLLKEDVSTVPVWVKLHGVPVTAFSEDGLSAIATKLGTPLMLDSYTSDMCMQSWGRLSYARVMIELRAYVELKDNIVVAMPKITMEGHYTCNVRVEYEWKPPRCSSCRVFGHIHKECLKNTGAVEKKTVKKPSQTSQGVSVCLKMGFKHQKEYRPVPKKTTASSSGNKKKGVEPTIEKTEFDAVGKAGISTLVKCTSAIRQLAHAAVPDSLDEYLQIGEKTSRDCLMHFCNGVIELYGKEYLRKPTQTDVEKLYAFHEKKHGFPSMIGNIDCTKWMWAQCPQAYRAQFSRGDSRSGPFILLEAVASQDLWIWHAFFGVARLNNDVNILRQSHVLNDLKVGKAPEVPFVANDVTYKWGYYLTDGIYPEWAVLMKPISQPKRIRYKQAHEAARKDVERAFGVLKKKWVIVRTPARSRSFKRITHLMYTCIILHNMIRQNKKKAISGQHYPEEKHREDDPVRSAQDRLQVIREIHDEETHLSLKADLVEHIWHRTNAH
ncbi:ALP1-like protein [Tanacetum coccineum]